MSNGYRNGAFALGLVVGGGLALNLFLWLDYLSQDENHQYAKGEDTPQYSQVGQHWDGFIRTFVSPSDTLAQWIMAAFTIAATIVLIFTLRSANKTNAAAITASKSALEANDILRQEQRPWVTLERELLCDFHDNGHGGRITWHYEFINKGRGPAYDIRMDIELIKRNHWQGMHAQIAQFTDQVLNKQRLRGSAVLFPGERTEHRRYIGPSMARYREDGYSVDSSGWGEAKAIMLMVYVSYRIGPDSDELGYDGRVFEIEPSDRWIGPWAHTILEHGSVRIIG